MTIKSELEKIVFDDNRHTFTDFVDTFELNLYWSDNTITKIIDNLGPTDKGFIENAVKVYRIHTKKYPSPQEVIDEIHTMVERFYYEKGVIVDIRDIEKSTGLKHLTIERNLLGHASKNVNDIYDVLALDLIKRNKNDLFNNLLSYKRLERKIMQAQVASGCVKTLDEIASQLKIDVSYLKHPEWLCKKRKLFSETILALDDWIEQQVNLNTQYQVRTTRVVAGLGKAIQTKPFVNNSHYENGLLIPLNYGRNLRPGFFVLNQDLPILLNDRQKRRAFFKKATTKDNAIKSLTVRRKQEHKRPYTLTLTQAAKLQLLEIIQYMHVNRSTMIDYCIENLNSESKLDERGSKKYKDHQLIHEPISVSLSDASYLKLKTISSWSNLSPGEYVDYIIDEVYLEWLKYRKEIRKKSVANQHSQTKYY